MTVRRALSAVASLLAILACVLLVQGCGRTEGKNDIVTNGPPPVQITSPGTITPGKIYVPYNYTLQATGGVGAPYTWTLNSGGLPFGVFVGPGGVISGTPQAGGTYLFNMQASDSTGSSITRDFKLFIGP
ncbi:hypothetical protein HY251_06565 [bacterium]|nr:hypothetical protein [bacterium]